MPPAISGYYFGEQAIAHRLGFRSKRIVTRLALTAGLPIYPRRRPNPHGKGWHRTYAISESAITAWELARANGFLSQLRARAAAKQEQADRALRVQKRLSAHDS